jgi:hypothetical protein
MDQVIHAAQASISPLRIAASWATRRARANRGGIGRCGGGRLSWLSRPPSPWPPPPSSPAPPQPAHRFFTPRSASSPWGSSSRVGQLVAWIPGGWSVSREDGGDYCGRDLPADGVGFATGIGPSVQDWCVRLEQDAAHCAGQRRPVRPPMHSVPFPS